MNKRMGLMALLVLLLGQCFGAQATEKVTIYLTDALGSPVVETDSQGNVTATAAYRPYGTQVMGASATGPGFTGHANDVDTGLVYMQARYYDPEVGRFLSTDPAGGFKIGQYQYTNNNPITLVDPDGLDPSGQNEPECQDIECRRARQAERERRDNQPYTGGGIVLHENDNGGNRKTCVINGGGCIFIVADNANADNSAPWFESHYYGSIVVNDNEQYIIDAARMTGVNINLIRAVMYMEASHGYYDTVWTDLGFRVKSILPMNIYADYWGGHFGTWRQIQNPQTNVLEGARMLESIESNLPPNAPVSHIATLYNNIWATKVSNYGARVQAIYDGGLWW